VFGILKKPNFEGSVSGFRSRSFEGAGDFFFGFCGYWYLRYWYRLDTSINWMPALIAFGGFAFSGNWYLLDTGIGWTLVCVVVNIRCVSEGCRSFLDIGE
jgi:hypothetical protein